MMNVFDLKSRHSTVLIIGAGIVIGVILLVVLGLAVSGLLSAPAGDDQATETAAAAMPTARPTTAASPTAAPMVHATLTAPTSITATPTAGVDPLHDWVYNDDVYIVNPNGARVYFDDKGRGESMWFAHSYVLLVKGPPVFDEATGVWWWPVCTRQGSVPWGIITEGWIPDDDLDKNQVIHNLSC